MGAGISAHPLPGLQQGLGAAVVGVPGRERGRQLVADARVELRHGCVQVLQPGEEPVMQRDGLRAGLPRLHRYPDLRGRTM